jgi:hypothetical protein
MRKVEEFIIPGQDNTDYVLVCKPLFKHIMAYKANFIAKDAGISGQHPEPDSNEAFQEDGLMECESKIFCDYDN